MGVVFFASSGSSDVSSDESEEVGVSSLPSSSSLLLSVGSSRSVTHHTTRWLPWCHNYTSTCALTLIPTSCTCHTHGHTHLVPVAPLARAGTAWQSDWMAPALIWRYRES